MRAPTLSAPTLSAPSVAVLLSSLVLGVVACGPRLLGPTAVKVGCYESEVQISGEAGTWDKRTWTAVCRGKTWDCSGTEPPGGGQLSEIGCKMRDGVAGAASGATPAGPAAPAGGGCLYDNQCKGERVCSKGVCVEPPNAATPAPPPPKAAPTPTTPPAATPTPAATPAPAGSGSPFFQ